jgi:hypothetical protein
MTSVPSDIRPDRRRGRAPAPPGTGAHAQRAALVCLAAPAQADVGATIIERCAQGKSIAGYTEQDYRRALQELPTEVEEYSPCGQQIRRAELAAAGGRASSSGLPGAGVSATPLTPAEQRGIAALAHTPTRPLRVGNQLIHPGVVHADISSAFSSLPNALLAVLALMAAGALALAARTIRNRVRNRSAG